MDKFKQFKVGSELSRLSLIDTLLVQNRTLRNSSKYSFSGDGVPRRKSRTVDPDEFIAVRNNSGEDYDSDENTPEPEPNNPPPNNPNSTTSRSRPKSSFSIWRDSPLKRLGEFIISEDWSTGML